MEGSANNVNNIIMRLLQPVLYIMMIAVLASCTHGNPSNDNATITVNGRLGPNPYGTLYTYGTNIIVVSASTSYFVKSTVIVPLASFEGDSVQATLKDMGIRQNPGPELYNVIAITPLP